MSRSDKAQELILDAWRREADRARQSLERLEDLLAGLVSLSLGTAVIGVGAVGYVGHHKGSPLDFVTIAGIFLLGVAGVASIGARVQSQSSASRHGKHLTGRLQRGRADIDDVTTLNELAELEQKHTTYAEARSSIARRLVIGSLIFYLAGVFAIAAAVYIAVP